MAKNWTVAEAYEALRNGDKEARIDIGRRFPLFATATEDEIISALPSYLTARKLEALLKEDAGVSEDDVEEVEEVEEAKPAKKAKAKKVVEDDEDEEEDEVPKKPVKKAKAKKAVVEVEDEDEDDDMDDF